MSLVDVFNLLIFEGQKPIMLLSVINTKETNVCILEAVSGVVQIDCILLVLGATFNYRRLPGSAPQSPARVCKKPV